MKREPNLFLFYCCLSNFLMIRLKFLFVNASSIVSRYKRHYLRLFVEEHKPDVLMIAEHHLSARHNFELRGYTVYRQDRTNRRGRGTAILLTDRLKETRITTDLGAVEGTVVKMKTIDGRNLVMMSLYKTSQEVLTIADLEKIAAVVGTDEAVIGGDLNARQAQWGRFNGECKRKSTLDPINDCGNVHGRTNKVYPHLTIVY